MIVESGGGMLDAWSTLKQQYFGREVTDSELARCIDQPSPHGAKAWSSFLEACVRRCQCTRGAPCLVMRCLSFRPLLVDHSYGQHASILDFALVACRRQHVELLCEYGARVYCYDPRRYPADFERQLKCFDYYEPYRQHEFYLSIEYLCERRGFDWKAPACLTPRWASLRARFGAREYHCRRAAVIILRVTGLLKELRVLIAQRVWATRLSKVWEV